MEIYVVMGTTGEYSDRREWQVKAFKDEEKAKELVLDAEKRASEIEATRDNEYRAPARSNEFDPYMDMDYTGTTYYYFSVELE